MSRQGNVPQVPRARNGGRAHGPGPPVAGEDSDPGGSLDPQVVGVHPTAARQARTPLPHAAWAHRALRRCRRDLPSQEHPSTGPIRAPCHAGFERMAACGVRWERGGTTMSDRHRRSRRNVMSRTRPRRLSLWVMLAALGLVAGCSSLPTDPQVEAVSGSIAASAEGPAPQPAALVQSATRRVAAGPGIERRPEAEDGTGAALPLLDLPRRVEGGLVMIMVAGNKSMA